MQNVLFPRVTEHQTPSSASPGEDKGLASLAGSVRYAGRWESLILGPIAALFVSRLVLEFGGGGASGPALLIGSALLAVLTLVAIAWAHSRLWDLGPLAVLGVYLISPGADVTLAGATLFAAISATGLLWFERISPRLIDVVIIVGAFVAYGATLSPDVLPHDSGELQFVAPALGIAHPPGYALYTMLGKLFSLLPLHTPAWRMNLVSAVLAPLTLVLVARSVRELTGSLKPTLIAVFALAGVPTFWAIATTTNVRMLTAFFTALLCWLLLREARGHSPRLLALTAFVFGLAVTHHGSLIFMAVPAAVLIIGAHPRILGRGRELLAIAVAFLASLSVLLYFPIRSASGNAVLDPGGLTTLDGLLRHVLARGFMGDVLYFNDTESLLARLEVLRDILVMQLGWPLLAVALVGLVPLPRVESPRTAVLTRLFLAGTVVLIAIATITYRAAQTVEYLTPVYVALSILVGVGAQRLAMLGPSSRVGSVILAAALLPGVVNVARAAPSFVALSQSSDTRSFVEPLLRDAPEGATILADWHWVTPLRYLQVIEGQRTDVNVEYVVPSDEYGYDLSWRHRLIEAYARGPVIATSQFGSFNDLPFPVRPFHQALIASSSPSQEPLQASPDGAMFGSVLEMVGASLTSEIKPGHVLPVRLAWRPVTHEVDRDYSVFLHLVGADGQPLAQADVGYSAATLRRGEVIEQDSRLALMSATPPGDYRLIAGVYFAHLDGRLERLTTPSGKDHVELATVQVTAERSAPVVRHPLREQFVNGPRLEGVDLDTSVSPDHRLYLHWSLPNHGGPWTAVIMAGAQELAERRLPSLPDGGRLSTALDVPANVTDLQVAVRDRDGEDLRLAGAWYWPIERTRAALPSPRRDARFLNFEGEVALTETDVTRRGPKIHVDLTWLSLRPLVRDYRVSVQLRGDGWQVQDDDVPALGAIPTTKWIRGTSVKDRRTVLIPEQARGPIDVHVVVYDAFSQAPLTVLDERLLRNGQGQGPRIARLPAAEQTQTAAVNDADRPR